jgi:hypothetical protein
MPTTTTASSALSSVPVKDIPVGVVSQAFTWTAQGETTSATHIFLVGKIPHGARILDVYTKQGIFPSATAGCEINVGMLSDPDMFIKSLTASAMLRGSYGLPYDVSVSSSDAAQYEYLVVQIGSGITSATTTGSMTVVVTYERVQGR